MKGEVHNIGSSSTNDFAKLNKFFNALLDKEACDFLVVALLYKYAYKCYCKNNNNNSI